MSTVIIHTIEARTHGRYLVDRLDTPGLAPLLVGFHGFGEPAEAMLGNLRAMGRREGRPASNDDWCLVSVQALHRFYTRNHSEIVACWMTSQDRELEIADNTAYVWSAVRAVERDHRTRRPLVLVGFSQGVAMAYRAAAEGGCDALIVLAGDVPPDVKPRAASLPPILLARGNGDQWYTAQKAAADLDVLRGAGAAVVEHVFEGGHLWDPSVTTSARRFLAELQQ